MNDVVDIGFTFHELKAMEQTISNTRIVNVPEHVDIKALRNGLHTLRGAIKRLQCGASNTP